MKLINISKDILEILDINKDRYGTISVTKTDKLLVVTANIKSFDKINKIKNKILSNKIFDIINVDYKITKDKIVYGLNNYEMKIYLYYNDWNKDIIDKIITYKTIKYL